MQTNFSFIRCVLPDILSTNLVRMEDVNLWSTSLAKLQVMRLFDLLASSPSSLRSLNIGENSLLAVQATNLAKSLRKVKDENKDQVASS